LPPTSTKKTTIKYSTYPKLPTNPKSKKHIEYSHFDSIQIKIKQQVHTPHHTDAKDAFNHISHAYTVLIDPEKRQHYDRFGPEVEQARPQNPQRNGHQDYQFQEYDDIFRMFFGQGPMNQQFRQGGGPQFRT
jgi:hypothetical protein